MKKYLAISALALLLAACGGSNSSSGSSGSGTPPQTMVDAFFTTVSSFIGMTSDSTEPGATDGVTATAPENTEPATVL